jgi:hypothetical protein
MKLIIAGSREIIPTIEFIHARIEETFGIQKINRIISGGARGVDLAGERWAEWRGLPYVRFVPGWGVHGKKTAGYLRNIDMSAYGDACLAIWDGHSRGTLHMVEIMKKLQKPVHVIQYEISSN